MVWFQVLCRSLRCLVKSFVVVCYGMVPSPVSFFAVFSKVFCRSLRCLVKSFVVLLRCLVRPLLSLAMFQFFTEFSRTGFRKAKKGRKQR